MKSRLKSLAARRFWRMYNKLPGQIRKAAKKAYALFCDDPSHPSLQFERLKYDPGLWSVRVTEDYRAVGKRDRNVIVWFFIGKHEEFDRKYRAK